MKNPIIKLEDVWKIYRLGKTDLPALQGVDLEIEPGSFITIMGPSGSGKSTLLNMIGALDVPTRGRVLLKNQDINLFSEDQLSYLRGKTIGFVFQEFNILPNLNAVENVTLPMIFQGVSLEAREARARELLKSVDLQDRMDHQPAELSAGQRQRVAIARAFANNPEMVIADEPTGNLDSVTGRRIMEILTGFHEKQKKTIVIVTHDINIANYGEKIIHIKDGRIVVNHNQNRKSL